MRRSCWIFLLTFCIAVQSQAAGQRRALLIGINDYSASRFGPAPGAMPNRDWADLHGAVNDVIAMREMLVLRYGFEKQNIVVLTDQQATRSAILQLLERHLVKPAGDDDVLLFYFAGHGSQVRNSLSDEPDGMDESLVPADSRAGAPDLRDKELRPLFNAILDKGARLTVILDNCHSGSGARGLATGARPRGIRADARDIRMRSPNTPRPEEAGALVLSATQDYDMAWETRDEQGNFHGAFSWSLLRAIRDTPAGEPASETFLRAQARMRAETPFQDPVIAGNEDVRRTPFLGSVTSRAVDHPVIVVENVKRDGTLQLQGGWAHGLSIGTELRVTGERESTVRVKVTQILGLGRSQARIQSGLPVKPGTMLEMVGWAAPSGRPLRVWMPRVSGDARMLAALARRLLAESLRRGVHWVTDPLEVTPTHLLRRGTAGWELVAGSRVELLGTDANGTIAAVMKLRAGASLFVQLPASAAMVDGIDIGQLEGVVPSDGPIEADYVLLAHYAGQRLEYAWMRPAIVAKDQRKSALPPRTDWTGSVSALREAMLRLRRIHAWSLLESPLDARWPYRLALQRRGGELAKDALIGNETYKIVLRRQEPPPSRMNQRFIYVFVIDSFGKSVLLFPRSGSVENRLPLALPPPREIPLGSAFEITPPFGVDTYFLLTTDEPLPNPWILEWDGVRTRAPESPTPLEQLLLITGSGTRAGSLVTPVSWSLERIFFVSRHPAR